MGRLGCCGQVSAGLAAEEMKSTYVSSGIQRFCTPSPSDDVTVKGCVKGIMILSRFSIAGSAVKMGSSSTSLSYALPAGPVAAAGAGDAALK